MVKIGGPVNTDSYNDNDRSERKYLPSKRGCLKFGCLMPLGLFLIMAVIGALFGVPEEGSDDDAEQATQTEELRYEDIDTSIEAREYSVGKADKHISELGDLDPQPVDNDKTGNWRVVEHDKGVDFTPYVLSYAEEYMNDDEIHWIVDRTNNTLTSIINSDYALQVYIYEHNEDDGIDALSLGRGFELGDYWVYTDNGDIEDFAAIIRDEADAAFEAADDNVDYAVLANPERLNMTDREAAELFTDIKVEGTVVELVTGSVPGFGTGAGDDVHHFILAIDGDPNKPIFVRYVSDTRFTPFELGEELVVMGYPFDLLERDGTYIPTLSAERVE